MYLKRTILHHELISSNLLWDTHTVLTSNVVLGMYCTPLWVRDLVNGSINCILTDIMLFFSDVLCGNHVADDYGDRGSYLYNVHWW